MNGVRPKGWTVLGGGAMADALRAEIDRDPDRYAPETWSVEPAGVCPCCSEDVFRCTTRHTGWSEGFATHANALHVRCNDEGYPDPNGKQCGCCCVAPNFGPMHDKALKRKPKRRRERLAR